MADDKYEGWNLYDKVIIVEKVVREYDRKSDSWVDSGNRQGYIVDPKNKKQLENAKRWGATTLYEYGEDEIGCRNIKETHTYAAKEYIFDNNDFEIELLDSAEGSSQGGKLSFWNCKISKDGKSWIVGINADLLLRALVSCTWVNGKCSEPVLLARCKGGVGVLPKSSPEYIQAQKDMEAKANMSKGKTTKYKVGHCYETVTEASVYFGKVYCWYEPIFEHPNWECSTYLNRVIGYRLLKQPIEKELMFDKCDNFKNASEYLSRDYYYQLKDKCPSRKEGSYTINIDITNEQLQEFLFRASYYKTEHYKHICHSSFGYSVDKNKPLKFTEEQIEILRDCGLKILKEE